MRERKKYLKSKSGITLVALVVTIIVLIILATVSIGSIVGKKGIINQAKEAKKAHEEGVTREDQELNELLAEYKNSMSDSSFTNGTGGSGSGDTDTNTTDTPPTPEVPKGPNGNQLVTSITDTNHEKIVAEDSKGNQVVVPKGFKFAEDCGNTVQDGIVIEDGSGNQFVWVPVSNINHDGTGKIVKNDGSEVEITLGRYTFNTSTGVETKAQYGSEWETTVTIASYYQERGSDSKDLEGFISSVETNHGYYIGRYEASYASGSTFGLGTEDTYYKPLSKPSTANSTSSMSYTAGTLWNFITKANAVTASRQMYYNNNYVVSDLVNSYMWDTAIVYIQAMGNSNYANTNRGSNTTLKNTGETGDEKCHIFDMASNLYEWTTEYSTGSGNPCVGRGGGYYYSTNCTARRDIYTSAGSLSFIGFRVGLWLQ